MTTYKKDPNATLDYTFDWTAYLAPLADTITSAAWVLGDTLTMVSQTHTTTTATIFVSGGTLGNIATLTCRITTAGGRTDDRTVNLKIVAR